MNEGTFTKWLKDSGLTEESINSPYLYGFTSKTALSCAQAEDVEAMDIPPLAKQRVMEAIIRKASGGAGKQQGDCLTPGTSQQSSSSTDCPVPGLDVGDPLATLFANMDTGSSPTRIQPSATGEID